MSEVHVYPLDDAVAVYRNDIELLAHAAYAAAALAEQAAQLVTHSTITATAYAHHAPLTHGPLVAALQRAISGPASSRMLARSAEDLAESLSTAVSVYAEAEWTLERVMQAHRPLLGIARAVRGAPSNGRRRSDPATVHALLSLIANRLQAGAEGENAAALQAEMRELGVQLRAALQNTGMYLGAMTRDGRQFLSDRGPIQGAALLLLAWANLAELEQSVTVRQVPAVGAPTDEMDTAVIPSISGIPAALEWTKATRTLSDETGRIALVSHTLDDGSTAWTVLIPGTQSLYGGTNPQDWESNLELTAGLSSELMAAVVAVMRSAPIRPGDAVTLVGHSQGGIVASALASNEELREEFRIEAVVTAGSPVGQFDAVPEDVLALHLEDINDIVPAVDGLANTASDQHMTLVFDPSDVAPDPHGHDNYAALVETVQAQGNSPELDRMASAISEIAGWQSDGDARLYSFEFERDEASPPIVDLLVQKALDG